MIVKKINKLTRLGCVSICYICSTHVSIGNNYLAQTRPWCLTFESNQTMSEWVDKWMNEWMNEYQRWDDEMFLHLNVKKRK